MLKIGDFSRIAHVTVKALRHYSREGLLQPVSIDRFSGYRYYTLDQLGRLNRILALKDLGFSLEQIRRILNQPLSADELRGMLRLKQAELAGRIEMDQTRLARVQQRLAQIETEGSFSQAEVVIRRLPAQTVAVARSHAASADQLAAAQSSLEELLRGWIRQHRLRAAGPWFILLDDREYRERNLEVEIGVVIEAADTSTLRKQESPVKVITLPEIASAACFVPPPDMDLAGAYELLMRWIESNGCRVAGAAREVLLNGEVGSTDPVQLIELQVPVKACKHAQMENEKERISEMEPIKFVNLPAFKVMGMKYRGKNLNQEISKLWGELNPRAGEIPITGDSAYGVCFMIPDAEKGEFEYVAGFEVKQYDRVPDGMLVVDVPAARYAVFAHRGSLETLGETYRQIYEEWFPGSSFKPHGGYDMEVYNEDFKNFSPDSVFYIYEPVE